MLSKLMVAGTLLLTFVAFVTLVISWPLGIVRAATNEKLGPTGKILWILAQFFFFIPASLLYLVAVDRSFLMRSAGFTACAFLGLLALLATYVPQMLTLAGAAPPPPVPCQEEIAQSDWYKQINARTEAISGQLKELGDKAKQDPTVPLSQPIVYREMRTRLESAETYLLACRLPRETYVKALDRLEKKINTGTLDDDFVASWDKALPAH